MSDHPSSARAVSVLCLWLGVFVLEVAAGSVPITALAFSPDGAWLLSNGPRRIDLLSPTDGQPRESLPCDLDKITALTFQLEGHLLAIAGGSPAVRGEVRLYDWNHRRWVGQFTNHTDLCTGACFSQDGSLLAVASADGLARVWKLGRNQNSEAYTLSGHAGPILAVAFSPTGAIIVTGSADRSIKVWSAEDGHLLRTFNYHTEAVHTVAFRPPPPGGLPSAMCASGAADRTVRIWQPEIGRMVRIIRGHGGPILALAYSPDGGALFSAGQEGIIRQLDPESDAILHEWPDHEDWIYALAVSPDGRWLANGDWAGRVRVREVGGKTPNSKPQAPGKLQTPSSNRR